MNTQENEHVPENRHDESEKRTWVEEIEVKGNQLVDRVKELSQESSTKRVVIRAHDGKEVMSVPLTFGVVAEASRPWVRRYWPRSGRRQH